MKSSHTTRHRIRVHPSHYLCAALAVCGLGLLANGFAQTLPAPLVQYDFNENAGSTAANSGSLGSAANLTVDTTASHTTWSSNSFAPSAGSAVQIDGTGGKYIYGNGAPLNTNLTAFTVTFWMNLQSTDGGADRLLGMSEAGHGFDIRLNNYLPNNASPSVAKLSLWVDGANSGEATNTVDVIGKWAFIAVTYNGAVSSNQIAFFTGSATVASAQSGISASPVGPPTFSTPVDTGALDTVVATADAFRVGSTPLTGLDRGPAAFFDDLRIYGELLDASQIEAVRLNGLGVSIPEPSAASAIVGGFMLLAGFGRRRKRLA